MHPKRYAKLIKLTVVFGGFVVPAAAQGPASCTGKFSQTVTITISSAGSTANANPDRACVARGGAVNWTAKDGDSWMAEFASANASPLAGGAARRQGKVGATDGGTVKPCAKNSPFFNAAAGGCLYKFKATHVRGSQKAEVDPDVIVEP